MGESTGEMFGKGEKPSLQSEYRFLRRTLNEAHLLTISRNGEPCVLGIDGQEYILPTEDEVHHAFEKNRTLVEFKKDQGFDSWQLTPLAMPIEGPYGLLSCVKKTLVYHAEHHTLFQSVDEKKAVDVDLQKPVWIWGQLEQAMHTADGLLYFPQTFTKDGKGKTKSEVITDPNIVVTPGWSLCLMGTGTTLPKEGQGKTVGGRPELENNHSPNEYLQKLQESAYQGETGWTVEDFLTNFLITLTKKNQVSHEWEEGSVAWLLANYLPSDSVPSGRWDRNIRQMHLDGDEPRYRDERWGVPSTVRLGL
jgi:hypothetical protein